MQGSFSLLDKRIQNALTDLEFNETPIQEKAIPEILTGRNALLIAPTGIGKTEAALLPILHNFLKKPSNGIGILYITPLRALNRNMIDRVSFWGEKLGLSSGVRHGDTTQYERSKQLKNPPQIMVTTPETLNLLLAAPKMGEHLKNVKHVIIDEVHELIESKRGAQLSIALERLVLKSGGFQRIGLSATVGNPSYAADFFRLGNVIESNTNRKIELSVEMPKPSKEDVELSLRLNTHPDVVARLRRLKQLIDEHTSVLTFVNTRSTAEVLSSRFEAWEGANKIAVHHSSLSKDVRVVSEDKFKEGKLKGLIATSSLELGIDIGFIDLVVQYSSPRQVNRLIQRIGRSGHDVKRFPKGIIMANDYEDALESAVIVKSALNRILEQPAVLEKPLDVLAHQLAGIAFENSSVEKLSAFSTVRKAFPYRNLEFYEFEDVLKQLADEGIIWLEESEFGRRKKARFYYFLGVSMIPDESRFFVKDIASNRNIGVLDETFVVNSLSPGGLFITHGKPWNVVDISEKEVLVEPAYDLSGAIPAWEGEQIPVPFATAQEVGILRRKIASGKEKFKGYFLDANSSELITRNTLMQKDFFIPDEKNVFIECEDNFAVMHACFGSKTNETLGKMISALISSQLGETVAMKSDPYRIIFEFLEKPRPDLVKKFMEETEPEQIKEIITRSIARTNLFKFKFMHVAKRFGLIEKNRGLRVSIPRVIDAVFDSPIYRETLNEIFTEKFDLKNAENVLERVKKGKIVINEYYGPISPYSKFCVSKVMRLSELVSPQRPESEIIDLMIQQSKARTAKLFCTYCGNIMYGKVEDLPEKIKCTECKSPLVSFIKGRREIKPLYSGKKLSKEEQKEKGDIDRVASLVSAYGKKAVVVLSGKGIGSETAVRVLGNRRLTEKEMFKDMLEAQKAFLKTKRFWK